jgi:hypothetical protein
MLFYKNGNYEIGQKGKIIKLNIGAAQHIAPYLSSNFIEGNFLTSTS